MNQIGNSFTSIEQVTNQYLNNSSFVSKSSEATTAFEELLLKKYSESTNVSELKFSKHATQRLDDRNISLSEEQNERLASSVAKAGEKGINESLVILDSLAFIVNVPNQTVVTALDSNETQGNVFTNIDGAVIA